MTSRGPSFDSQHGPTFDERIQVFEARNLTPSLVALGVFAMTVFYVLARVL